MEELSAKTNNFQDAYTIYKWYDETRKRWEVRMRTATYYTNRIFHSPEDCDAYMTQVRGVMKGKEKVFKSKGKYRKNGNQ